MLSTHTLQAQLARAHAEIHEHTRVRGVGVVAVQQLAHALGQHLAVQQAAARRLGFLHILAVHAPVACAHAVWASGGGVPQPVPDGNSRRSTAAARAKRRDARTHEHQHDVMEQRRTARQPQRRRTSAATRLQLRSTHTRAASHTHD